MLANLRQN